MSDIAVLSKARRRDGEPWIGVPALGLTVRVRTPVQGGAGVTIIETTHAAGSGPPLYRRREQETFEILSGRFLFDVDGTRFMARRGDLVSVPSGVVRTFVNVAGVGGRQHVIVQPGFDAERFYREFDEATRGAVCVANLRRFGKRWHIRFVGAPLQMPDAGPLAGMLQSIQR